MKRVVQEFVLAIFLATATGLVASAAMLTPLASPAGFTSPTTYSNDFESAINMPQFTFDATAQLVLATIMSGGTTSSGVQGLREYVENGPLNVTFASPVHEIGMFFGNDDFGFQFNAVLEVFDAANASLGSVQVAANRNDHVDQFLGVRSDTPIKSAAIFYQRPQAQSLAVFVDDFRIGIVPEPTGVVLIMASLLCLAAGFRSHRGG
jgi:hypothetical protein